MEYVDSCVISYVMRERIVIVESPLVLARAAQQELIALLVFLPQLFVLLDDMECMTVWLISQITAMGIDFPH